MSASAIGPGNGPGRPRRPQAPKAQPSPASSAAIENLRALRARSASAGLVVSGSVEGILTGVGIVYLSGGPCQTLRLHLRESCQPSLEETLIEVDDDEPLAHRVLAGFRRATSPSDSRRVIYACQSDDPRRPEIVSTCMAYGFSHKERLWNHRAHAAVAPLFDLAAAVSQECEHARQFVRFHKMASGIYWARFEPKANVVPLVMRHFAERLNTQPFVIHDPCHHVAGMWDGRSIQLVNTVNSTWEQEAARQDLGDHDAFEALWKRFYDSIAIEARTNHELRRHFMPVRFWKNLPEMNPMLPDDNGDPSGPAAPRRPIRTPATEAALLETPGAVRIEGVRFDPSNQ